jgi:DNA-binding transcriptional regulator YbjK
MSRSNSPILEATLRVIAQGGVNAVRYREVAAEAGVSLGTVSYQYPSREELIRAAFRHFLTEDTHAIRAIASARTIETPEDVAGVCVELLRASFAKPGKPYLAEFELLVYAARDERVAEALAASDRTLALEIGAVLDKVGIQSPRAAAQTLVEMIRGFQLTALGKRDPDLGDLENRLTRLLTALGPPAPEKPPRKPARARAPRAS